MMEPTPGPWFYDEKKNPETGHYFDGVFAIGARAVCYWPRTWADAQLIAAAPDLYRLAQDLLAADKTESDWSRFVHRASECVSKAEGRE